MTTEQAVETIRRWDFEPGKGGVPRVPEWVAPMFDAYAAAVLHLPDELDNDALLCHQLLRRLNETCGAILGKDVRSCFLRSRKRRPPRATSSASGLEGFASGWTRASCRSRMPTSSPSLAAP